MPRGRQCVRRMDYECCTLKDASEEFYNHNRIKGLAPSCQKNYKNYISNFVKWCGEDMQAEDVNANIVEKYLGKKTDEGLKTISVATTARHIRRFINFCADRDYMERFDVMIPKYEVELKEPYTDEEMNALLRKPSSVNWVEYRNWVMVNYFFSTGQRLSTVLNIKVCHLDLDKAKVKLIWNKDKIPKYMPLSSAMIKILREYIAISALDEQDFLFPEYEGKQLKTRSAEDAIADYNKKRGVSKTSIHLFRHTFAKNYILNGGNPVKLQKLLNHKTIDMTMKYVNLYSNDISKDLDLFNPLDNFKRKNYSPVNRRNVLEQGA